MTLDEKALERAAVAISGAPFPSKASLRKAEAAITAYLQALRPGSTGEAEFEVWQDDMPIAAASGPRDRALAEACHYAVVYGQDDPVEVKEVVRINVLSSSAMLAAAGGENGS